MQSELLRHSLLHRLTTSLPRFFAQLALNLPQRQTIHHVRFRQPAFARDADPEPQFLKPLGPVRVRVDHALHSLFLRERPPAPIEIEPLRRGVDLDPGAGLGGGLDDRRNVDRVADRASTSSRPVGCASMVTNGLLIARMIRRVISASERVKAEWTEATT